MEILSLPWFLAGGILLSLWIVWRSFGRGRSNPHRLPLPPGPKAYPFIGNLLDIPPVHPWRVYNQWSEVHGDIIHFKALGKSFMVLGSLKRINDLFIKRSFNYSDRPRMPMMVELMDAGFNFGLLPYGSWWRRHRRIFYDHFNPSVVWKYRSSQMKEGQALLRRLLDTPDDFMHHIRHTFAATVMDVTYGIQIKDASDPYIWNAEEHLRYMNEAGIAGRFLVDLIPILKYIPNWVPGAGFKKIAARCKDVTAALVNKPFELVKEKMKTGTASSCVATAMINNLPEEDDPTRDDEEVLCRETAAIAYIAGGDTTISAIQSFFLAMAKYPDVQKKAQAEIDSVIGRERLPGFDDRKALPYVNAMVKETMRWQLVLPLGVVHMSSEDDEYDGYFIPKGTVIMANTWAILHDPKAFDNPEEYIPERYVKDGKLDTSAIDPGVVAFGYGRRICPGRFLADNSLYAIISLVLTTYNIFPPVDDDGNPCEIEPAMTTGLISYPEHFKCIIKPRSMKAEALIRESRGTE